MSRQPSTVFLASSALVAVGGGALHAQTVFVTTVADVADFGGAKTVANLPGPDGKVSMREAAIASSNTAGPQTIGFQVPAGQWGTGTTGPKLIITGTSFVLSGDDTTVDGTTQTAFTGDTNPNGAEVSFHSTTTDVDLIQTPIFAITADRCVFVGLGDMTGRNYGLDFFASAEENIVRGCVIFAKFAAVRVQGDRNVIGGTGAGEGNTLDSLSDGLRIHGLSGSVAEDNVAFGNVLTGEFNGVQIAGLATGNIIGGFGPGESNLISGAGYFQEDGTPDGAMVRIESDSQGNFILGNRIGTDATGALAADNPGDVGVEIYGDGNEVRGNVIGGITGVAGFLSIQAGISLREGAEGNIVVGNRIGVDASGTIAIPNHIGIQIGPFDPGLEAPLGNEIGGLDKGEGNVIAQNEAGGVVVTFTATGNRIANNEIHDNHSQGGIAIDLGADGKTANDAGDFDAGPNDLMNFPRLATAVGSAQGTVITGRLDSPSPATATIEVFSNPTVGGVVEAALPIGTFSPKPDGTYQVLLATNATGLTLTATATDAAGNTSEVSEPRVVATSPWANAGFGLAGTNGVPHLAGGGTLQAGTEIAIVLEGALAQTTGFLIVGGSTVFVPLIGGTLVPNPQLIAPIATDLSGGLSVSAVFPGAPSGATLAIQIWLVDPAGIFGAAASNGIVGTVP